MAKIGHNKSGGNAAELLKIYIQRVEKLEEEKAEISSDIKDVFLQAKNNGFDVKAMRELIKLRKLTAAEREEHEAILDIYKAALGMLNDTPLGEAAIRKLTKKDHHFPKDGEKTDSNAGDETPDEFAKEEEKEDISHSVPTEIDIEDARNAGRYAALSGHSVISNPYPAHDPRRAAFDEAWCAASGSDGMEVPEAWQRKKPAKKDNEPKGGEA